MYVHVAHKKTESCAAHEILLMCFNYAAHKVLLTCSTQNIARVQYMQVDLHVTHFMSHTCTD